MNRIKIFRSDDDQKCYEMESQPFTDDFYYNYPCIDVDAAEEKHQILGFGASFTDAACWMMTRLPEEAQNDLIRDLFSPDGLNLSIGRLNVGSSDYATEIYCYDNTPDDVEMKDFSIEHDKAYLIPFVRKVKAFRPDLFLFSSPWSPPGWMKTGGEMCGGEMRQKYLPAFANYYTEYLKAYRAEGLEIDAATMQNEAETDQGGCMPQSRLHPDFEMELVGYLMPERLKSAGLHTKLWLHDHNYTGWKRICYMLSDPNVRANTDCVALHPYAGEPEMLDIISKQYPGTRFQLTEKGPNIRKDTKEYAITWWSRTISGAINHGCECFTGWNYALDEKGMPNTGPFDCAGLVEIHSGTLKVTPSIQYYAFKHYAPFIKRGATVLKCPVNKPMSADIDVLICRNPDGSHVAVIGNDQPGDTRYTHCIQLKYGGKYLRLILGAHSLTTVRF